MIELRSLFDVNGQCIMWSRQVMKYGSQDVDMLVENLWVWVACGATVVMNVQYGAPVVHGHRQISSMGDRKTNLV